MSPSCSWSMTRSGSTARPRTCSRSWLGASSPTRCSWWPPCATATPARLADAGLPEHRLTGLDDATAAALVDAAAPGLPLATRNSVLHQAAGNPLALLELPAAVGRPGGEQSPSGGLPLTERLERAFAGPCRICPMPLAWSCWSARSATRMPSARSLRRPLASPGLHRSRRARAGRRGRADRPRRQLHPVSGIPLIRSAVRQGAGVQQRRRVHEALAATLDADPDRRVWHCAALVSGMDEELARELEAAGVRARRRGAIDVALTALRRAVPAERPAATGRPHARHRGSSPTNGGQTGHRGRDAARDRAPRARAAGRRPSAVSSASCSTPARSRIDSRVAGLIATAEEAGAAGDREAFTTTCSGSPPRARGGRARART